MPKGDNINIDFTKAHALEIYCNKFITNEKHEKVRLSLENQTENTILTYFKIKKKDTIKGFRFGNW